MKTLLFVLCLVALSVTGLAQVPVAETTVAERTDVAVTAYNNGLALIRDARALALPEGELELKFQDVPEQIRPETVSLRSLAKPGSITIYEQNYEYDLINPQKLMEKYVGRQVRLINFSLEIGFKEVEAVLLSNNNGPVYQVGEDIYLGHPGNVVLPEIPENLIAKPSLIWRIGNTLPKQTLEATYLTNGVTWKADYVLTLPAEEKVMDLAGWVTLDNQSGATYANARLKLVAGDVNVVRGYGGAEFRTKPMALGAVMADGVMPQEESFAEYHLYTMPRRTTLKQNQSKQLALLNAAGVTYKKKYEYRGNVRFYHEPVPPMKEEHVSVFVEFKNEDENRLGIPLPAGIMRIYQEDSEGMLQFAGEDRIKHTPKDETVSLRMGKAFDIIGERVQTDFERVAPNVHECAFEITLRNHKEEDVVVDVVEPIPGDWRILEKSQDFEKKDAHTAIFHVPVPVDGETRVTYRARVKF